MSRASGFASVFALGVVSMLAATPAAAVFLCYDICNCTAACDKVCGSSGPPDFVSYYCGDIGRCAGGDFCTSPAMTCSSTINGDTLTSNSNNECINGNGGADTLSGNAGDDTIHGGDGDDSMYGLDSELASRAPIPVCSQ